MKATTPAGIALILCLALGSARPGFAQGTPWLDGTSILQSEKARQGIRPDAVPHQPFAARLAPGPVAEDTPPIGDLRPFWIVDFTSFSVTGQLNLNEDKVQIWGELLEISDNAYVYVDVSIAADPVLVEEMLVQFEYVIYPTIGASFGLPPDALDGDPHVTIFVSTFPGATSGEVAVAGYFDDANQYTDAEAMSMELGHSNEREMIYVNVDFLEEDPFTGELDVLLLGIFAHEYQHLVHWGLDPDEDLWVTEGCSEYAMVLCGYGNAVLQHMELFSVAPTVSVTEWQNTLENYGAVLYFMLYLDNHFDGASTITAIAADPLNGDHSVDNFLRTNYSTDFRTVFHNWAMANMLGAGPGDYWYAFPETPAYFRGLYEIFGFHELMPVFFTQRYNAYTGATAQTYLPIRTPEYYLFHRAAGESGDPFYGYIQVEGTWDVEVTYVGLDRTGTEDPYTYTLRNESPVQIDPTGYGEFQIPTDDDHFAIVLCNLTSHGDPATGSIDMNYELGILPGTASAIFDDLTAPAAVGDLAVVEAASNDRVTLSWTAPGDDGTTGHAALYDLRYSTSAASLTGAFDSAPRVPTVAFPGYPGSTELETCSDLPASTTLYFRLKTSDDRGNASFSNIVSTDTGGPDLTPPGQITDLHVVGNAGGSITVGWSAPGDDGYVGQADAYDLRYSLTPIANEDDFRHAIPASAPAPAVAGTPEEATIDGLAPGSYWVYVAIRSQDEMANVSEVSNVLAYLLSGSPNIASNPTSFSIAAEAGTAPATQTLTIWNSGGGTLGYILETSPTWLSSTPTFGFSDGPSSPVEHGIGFNTAALLPGDYGGTITVIDPGALNHPVEIPVDLAILPSPAQIAITEPAAGAIWQSGLPGNLAFTCSNFPESGDVDVYLHKGTTNLGSLGQFAFQNGANNASLDLSAWAGPGSDYRLELIWSTNSSVSALSEEFSIIDPPSVTISNPTGSAIWYQGIEATVEWNCTSNPLGDQLYLSLRGPEWRGWTPVDCVEGANSVQKWVPVNLTPGTYQLRFSWMKNYSVWWESEPFEIRRRPEISLVTPAGGETWQQGTLVPVEWNCTDNPDNDDMYLSLRGPEWRGWTTVPCHDGFNSAEKWIHVNLTPGTYRVRISWKRNYSVWWESNPITVIAKPSVSVTKPSGGTYQLGQPMNIQWNCSDNPTNDPMYISIKGPDWVGLGSVPSTDGHNNTTKNVPAGLTPGAYQIRLSWTKNYSVFWSSAPFTVTP